MPSMAVLFTSEAVHLTKRLFSSSVCYHLPRTAKKLQAPKTRVIPQKRPRSDSETKQVFDIDYEAIVKRISGDTRVVSVKNKSVRSFLKTVTESWNSLTSEEQQMLIPRDSSDKSRTHPQPVVTTAAAEEAVSKTKRRSRTVMTAEMHAYSYKERKKWTELIGHEKRFKRMKNIFLTYHKKPKKPTSDFMLFAEQLSLLGSTHVVKASEMWYALPEEKKQVYTEEYAKLLVDFYKKKQDWEISMRKKGYNMFCSGYVRGDVERYKALLDFFGKDDNIELLTREDDKSAVRRWKLNKGGDLNLKSGDWRFQFADEEQR